MNVVFLDFIHTFILYRTYCFNSSYLNVVPTQAIWNFGHSYGFVFVPEGINILNESVD